MLTLAQIQEQATLFVKSGLAPNGMTPDQAAIIALKGRELGLGMMESLEEIYVVNNRPSLSAKIMIALYTNAGHTYVIKERNAERVTILFECKDGKQYEHTLTMAECVEAHWNQSWDKGTNSWKDKPTWKGMPVVMLTYRAFSTGIRIIAPEVLHHAIMREEAEDMAERDIPVTVEGTVNEIEEPANWKNPAVRDELVRFQTDLRLDDHDAIMALSKAAGKDLTRRGEWTGTLTEAKRALKAFADERDGIVPTQAQQTEMF